MQCFIVNMMILEVCRTLFNSYVLIQIISNIGDLASRATFLSVQFMQVLLSMDVHEYERSIAHNFVLTLSGPRYYNILVK